MSVGAILTLGYGSYGSVNLVPTLGYGGGTAPAPAPSGGIPRRRKIYPEPKRQEVKKKPLVTKKKIRAIVVQGEYDKVCSAMLERYEDILIKMEILTIVIDKYEAQQDDEEAYFMLDS